MPTKEVSLWAQASPSSLELKNHAPVGFEVSKLDSSLFNRIGPVCILLYVDDLVITGSNLAEISQVLVVGSIRNEGFRGPNLSYC